jgi:hypothetical protein
MMGNTSSGFQRGARCAIDLLRQLETDEELSAANNLDVEDRHGQLQANPLLACVESVLATGDRRALEGLCSVLSGFVAKCAGEDLIPRSSYFAPFVEQDAKAAAAHDDRRFAGFMHAAGVRDW